MRAREIYGPLTDGGVVKPIHELRKMLDGKGTGNFAAFLALRQNLTEHPQRKFFLLPHVRRTHRIHRTGEDNGLQKGTVRFRVQSQLLIQTAQVFVGRGFTGKLVSQVLGDAGKSSPPDFAQNRVLAGKITEKSRLADFERLHDIVNACLLIPPLAKQSNCRIDNLLTKTRLLPFAEAERFYIACQFAPRQGSVQLHTWTPSCGWWSPSYKISPGGLRASHVLLFSWLNERAYTAGRIYCASYSNMRLAHVKQRQHVCLSAKEAHLQQFEHGKRCSFSAREQWLQGPKVQ